MLDTKVLKLSLKFCKFCFFFNVKQCKAPAFGKILNNCPLNNSFLRILKNKNVKFRENILNSFSFGGSPNIDSFNYGHLVLPHIDLKLLNFIKIRTRIS